MLFVNVVTFRLRSILDVGYKTWKLDILQMHLGSWRNLNTAFPFYSLHKIVMGVIKVYPNIGQEI